MTYDNPQERTLPAGSPGLVELFLAFSSMAAMGFGGVLPWARRMLVERKGWLTPDEFTEALSLCQFLPGGNIINLAIIVGQRFSGALGSAAATAGLLAAPIAIVMTLGALYVRYGNAPVVHDALDGLAAAAAGLILAMAGKMAAPLVQRRAAAAIAFAAVTFVGMAIFQFPLPLVLLVVAPASIALAWRSL